MLKKIKRKNTPSSDACQPLKRGAATTMKSFGPISFKWKALATLLILVVPLLIFICSFAVYTIRQQNDQLCENAENALFYHQNAL